MKDMTNNMDAVSTIDPDDYTSSENGSGVDLKGFNGAMAVAMPGTGDFADTDET